MRRPLGVILLTTTLLAACTLDEAPPELGSAEQSIEGDFRQGDFRQGTVLQGIHDAIWGFRPTGWANSGFNLKNAGVVHGHLVAQWDKTAACGPLNSSISRTCDWHTPGSASCLPTTSVTVRAGGCAASPAQRSMIRICSGRKPCAQTAAIASVDAACSGTTNPAVTFTCPSSGRYFVMVGPKNAGFGTPASSFTYTMTTTPTAIFATALTGTDFNGTTLPGERDGGITSYRISADPQVYSGDGTGTSSFYTLVDSATSAPLCYGTDNRAIPLAGRWYSDGTVDPYVTSTFTFACTYGVIAKCFMHDFDGYFPWLTYGGESLRDIHQTCTRAARADFCANGDSYTVNGTMIDLYDSAKRVTAQPNPGMEVEAIWRRDIMPTGASDVRTGVAPACLSKKRWDTMPYNAGGSCPGLSDPRTFQGEFPPRFCDELTVDEWWDASPDNLIATESALNDAGLWQWHRTSDGRVRSTASSTCTTADESSDCVADGFDYAPAADQPHLLGVVFHKDLDPSLRPGTIPLYTFRSATDRYLTTTDASWPGYGERVLEGYIRDTSCEATASCEGVRLDLWSGNGGYLTVAGGEDPGAPYTHWKTLGYMPR